MEHNNTNASSLTLEQMNAIQDEIQELHNAEMSWLVHLKEQADLLNMLKASDREHQLVKERGGDWIDASGHLNRESTAASTHE